MKKSLIAAGLLALMASAGANAADIITQEEPPQEPIAPVAAPAAPSGVDWNGAYAGGMIGGSWANVNTRLKLEKKSPVKKDINADSFVGGFYAGYNFQPPALAKSVAKDLILGVETDFLLDSGDGAGNEIYSINGADATYRASFRQKWNGATRLRAGYALGPDGRFLPYLAGGVSYAEIRGQARFADGKIRGDGTAKGDNAQNTAWDRYSKTKSIAGWNIGTGVDYIPPILDNHLIVRAEYRYTDFGTQTLNKIKRADGTVLKQKAYLNQNDFRVGVAYKF